MRPLQYSLWRHKTYSTLYSTVLWRLDYGKRENRRLIRNGRWTKRFSEPSHCCHRLLSLPSWRDRIDTRQAGASLWQACSVRSPAASIMHIRSVVWLIYASAFHQHTPLPPCIFYMYNKCIRSPNCIEKTKKYVLWNAGSMSHYRNSAKNCFFIQNFI